MRKAIILPVIFLFIVAMSATSAMANVSYKIQGVNFSTDETSIIITNTNSYSVIVDCIVEYKKNNRGGG
ncbi:MAG: hypothetical protein LBQ34_06710 [Alphaproteobacteria bacterium]|jgi:P pilus assembly chaperone PapD|nr:hypothetical protein [Alphaproteobacteria bacterium]